MKLDKMKKYESSAFVDVLQRERATKVKRVITNFNAKDFEKAFVKVNS